MMRFTDENLAQLGEAIKADIWPMKMESPKILIALLARLDAAEALCNIHGFDTVKLEEWKVWNKACGR